MISRGVEISIAGGGVEMVRGPIPWSFFFFFFFRNQIVIMFKVQKTHAALAMEIKNL